MTGEAMRNCATCGKPFPVGKFGKSRKYCSDVCKYIARYGHPPVSRTVPEPADKPEPIPDGTPLERARSVAQRLAGTVTRWYDN